MNKLADLSIVSIFPEPNAMLSQYQRYVFVVFGLESLASTMPSLQESFQRQQPPPSLPIYSDHS